MRVLNLPRRTVLLMVSALMVSASGISVSAASGAVTDSPSCVNRDETMFDVGIRDQRDRLTAQHAQEGDIPQGGDQEPGVFTSPAEDKRC
jgi:hypothetical protein